MSTHVSFTLLISAVLANSADLPEINIATKETYKLGSPVYINTYYPEFLALAYDSHMFVDKSLLIKEIFEDKRKVFLITCPHRWGKTINLQMIKKFLEYQVHNTTGKVLSPLEDTPNYQFFMNGTIRERDREPQYLTGPLLIARHTKIVKNYLGQFPVIHIDFDYTGENLTFHSLVEALRIGLSNAYSQHKYMLQKLEYGYRQDRLNRQEKFRVKGYGTTEPPNEDYFRFMRFFDFIYFPDDLTPLQVLDGVISLSEQLNYFHNKKVIVILDQYDSFWQRIFNSNWTSEDKTGFFKFYNTFLTRSFFKNEHLEKGIITGKFPPAKEHFEAFFDQTVHRNLMNGKLMEYYGFNQREMEKLFDTIGLPGKTRNQVARRYCGYRVPNSLLKIHNPYSIANFLSEDEFDNYWAKKHNLQPFINKSLQNVHFKKDFYHLIQGLALNLSLDSLPFDLRTTESLFQTAHRNYKLENIEHLSTEQLHLYLYILGYLTITEVIPTGNLWLMRFPNEEVTLAMKDYMHTYLGKLYGFHLSPQTQYNLQNGLRTFINDEKTLKSEIFEKTLENFFHEEHSCFDLLTSEKDTERVVLHDLFFYLLIELECNREQIFYPEEGSKFPNFVYSFDRYSTILNIDFNNPSIQSVLSVSKQYRYTNPIVELSAKFDWYKFVAINVLSNKTVITIAEFHRNK